MNKEWFEPGPDGVSPFERLSATVGFGAAGTAAAFRALLAAEPPALQVGDVDQGAEIARLTAEVERFNDYWTVAASQRDSARAEVSARNSTIDDLRAEVDNLRSMCVTYMKERDALQARIDGGRVMYGGMYGHENKFEMWTFEHVDTDTMTARLIDIAPIADAPEMVEERKGEGRKGQEMKLNWGAFGGRQFGTSATHPFSMQDKRTTNSDRRSTPGTRADRGE